MELKLPDIGEGVHEGEVVRWLVKTGDVITVDQPVIEIMTDKATVEIPSPHAGKVESIHLKEGEVVKVGQTLITLSEMEATSAKTSPQAKPSKPQSAVQAKAPTPTPQKATTQQSFAPEASSPSPQFAASTQTGSVSVPVLDYVAEPGKSLASPATRRLARELGVDLNQVPASGPHGRVTKEDLQKYAGAVSAGPAMVSQSITARSVPTFPTRGVGPSQSETLVPFRGVRRKISDAMTRSRQTIPDFTYVDECDVSELVEFRKEAKEMAEKQGVKLTYLPFIMKAVIKALRTFPMLNATLDEKGGNIIVKNYYNIGVAVDTEDGLVVPVVKHADQKSVLEIAAEIQQLADKAKNRKLSMDEMQGGTFTITNAGNIGGLMATPIINWPEVGIMGVHKISKKPIVKTINGKDEIVIAETIWLSVAVDHRVVDGAMAARFMNIVLDYLSNPKKLMLEMA